MVALVRHGLSMREVARRFHVSLGTVQLWCRRAGRRRLDRVDLNDRPSGLRRAANRIDEDLEDLILALRRQLKDHSPLGEHGAAAIRQALSELTHAQAPLPSLRTIGRVLERRGVLDDRPRQRWPAPPPGWYLPDLAAGQAELDSFDMVEDLRIAAGPLLQVLTGLSLHGRLADAWPATQLSTAAILICLAERWKKHGLPDYAQFDNDTRFQGPHQWPDVFGRVTRLCLSLGVVPIFAPPREPGFQNAIENFNGRWQRSVWKRFHVSSLAELEVLSNRFIEAFLERHSPRREAAPPRRAFPAYWTFKPHQALHGRLIFLRRADAHGRIQLLGHTFPVAPEWSHRLVRAEVDLDHQRIHIFGLRRREPSIQPLLKELHYQPKMRSKFR